MKNLKDEFAWQLYRPRHVQLHVQLHELKQLYWHLYQQRLEQLHVQLRESLEKS